MGNLIQSGGVAILEEDLKALLEKRRNGIELDNKSLMNTQPSKSMYQHNEKNNPIIVANVENNNIQTPEIKESKPDFKNSPITTQPIIKDYSVPEPKLTQRINPIVEQKTFTVDNTQRNDKLNYKQHTPEFSNSLHSSPKIVNEKLPEPSVENYIPEYNGNSSHEKIIHHYKVIPNDVSLEIFEQLKNHLKLIKKYDDLIEDDTNKKLKNSKTITEGFLRSLIVITNAMTDKRRQEELRKRIKDTAENNGIKLTDEDNNKSLKDYYDENRAAHIEFEEAQRRHEEISNKVSTAQGIAIGKKDNGVDEASAQDSKPKDDATN